MSLQDTYKPEDKDFDPLAHKSKQICTYIEEDAYNHILGDAKAFRMYLDSVIEQYPELFPVTIHQGYTFHDTLPESKKIPGIRFRRIKVKTKDGTGNDVFTSASPLQCRICPVASMCGETPVFTPIGVPYWALAYTFF